MNGGLTCIPWRYGYGQAGRLCKELGTCTLDSSAEREAAGDGKPAGTFRYLRPVASLAMLREGPDQPVGSSSSFIRTIYLTLAQ